MASAEQLRKENKLLKKELEELKSQASHQPVSSTRSEEEAKKDLTDLKGHVNIIVLGASGDLAKKKTFPSLFALYGLGLLPPNFSVFGFARSKMSDDEFRKFASQSFKGWDDKKQSFLSKMHYHSGGYDNHQSFVELDELIKKTGSPSNDHRMFYMAIPPSIFVAVAKSIKVAAMSKTGWNRVVIEKPFGRDSETSDALSRQLSSIFEENQMYRIDHYLGKEMVQNLMTLRFANLVFDPLWNRNHISCVQITFKEDIGTDGRGGYFDEFGIIRDVMQNHLLQIMALVAMEAPVTLSAEDVRDEKVKVLRACSSIKMEDVVVGQYGRDASGKKPSYLDDPTVPKGSIVPTFAAAVIHVNNARWRDVPFILKCGKALNERKAEIRIQFYDNPQGLYKNAERNELVLRVQPNEAVYMKFNSKAPGMNEGTVETELDLTYNERFDARLPDAYERLIYDVLRGDHNLFVRVDELEAAWKIFTPLLHTLEKEKIVPKIYPFGSRGPPEADELAARYGHYRSQTYKWESKKK